MNGITGYDDYERDYQNLALTEFEAYAEDKLSEELEHYAGESTITVYLPDCASKDSMSYTFTFGVMKDNYSEKGGVEIYYTGFY